MLRDHGYAFRSESTSTAGTHATFSANGAAERRSATAAATTMDNRKTTEIGGTTPRHSTVGMTVAVHGSIPGTAHSGCCRLRT